MKRIGSVLVAVAVALAAMVVLAGAADAHVTISAPGATRGGSDQEITFRVPVEEDHNTVGLTVQLPTDTPIASVDVAPVAGWTHTQHVSTLAKPIHTDDGDITNAVTRITWTAHDGGLKPGEFGAFTIIAGQLPDASRLVFRALQTYSNGSVVRWIQTAAPGSTDEPQFPAPTLELAASSAATSGPSTTSTHATTHSTATIVLSIVALVLSAAALGVSVVSRARRSAVQNRRS